MRDPIVAIALAGTARQERVDLATGTPVDALIAQLPEGEVERVFLLNAGARAVYRQAGTQAQRSTETVAPAGDETLRECSSGAAALVARLLTSEQDFLPEALERLRQQGLRLPYRLLPQVLNTTGKETRAALFPLLGERGRWLSQFNQSWKWVNNYLATDEDSLPADAEVIWQEGTPGQRVEILRRLRAVEPAKARDWLEAAWKKEKAEVRGDLMEALEIGLSAADEPFLEQALDDRSSSVRSIAANLLVTLPASAFSIRMRERGQSMIQMIDGHIQVEPPATLAADWQRDGLVEKHPPQLSPRAWWLLQTLSRIEPAFWEQHLGASPAVLLDLLPADDMWRSQVVEGWSRATRKFRTLAWMEPLWSWWSQHYQEAVDRQQLIEYNHGEELLRLMPGPMAERIVRTLIERPADNKTFSWSDLLTGLPRPWSSEFARVYLRFFRESCTLEKTQEDTFNPYGNPWLLNISNAAHALPVTCLAEALQFWDFTAHSKWQVQYAHTQLKEFTEIVHTRQKIYEEIG